MSAGRNTDGAAVTRNWCFLCGRHDEASSTTEFRSTRRHVTCARTIGLSRHRLCIIQHLDTSSELRVRIHRWCLLVIRRWILRARGSSPFPTRAISRTEGWCRDLQGTEIHVNASNQGAAANRWPAHTSVFMINTRSFQASLALASGG